MGFETVLRPSPPFLNAPILQDCKVLAQLGEYWLIWVTLLSGWLADRSVAGALFSKPPLGSAGVWRLK
jgi:hypothetical protein